MLKAENDELRTKLDHMNEILLNMQRARFGQSSEKQKYVSPDQLSVFNEAELEEDSLMFPNLTKRRSSFPNISVNQKDRSTIKSRSFRRKMFFSTFRKKKSSALPAESL